MLTSYTLNDFAATDSEHDFDPSIETDGSGLWITAWASMKDVDSIGTDSDILYSRSVDDGASWTSPAALNTNAGTDSGTDSLVRIAEGGGTWVAVWGSQDTLGGTIESDDDVLSARSTDGGMSWSAPIPVNNAAGDNPRRDTWPSLATDGLGRWVVVWESSSGNGPTGVDADIMASYSLNDGQSWSTPIAVNSWATIDTQGDYKPEIETDSAGRWIVVWRSNDSLGGRTGSDTDILVAHSTDVGASWSAAAPLYPYGETDNGSELSPGLATDGNGSWIVIYESDDPLGGSPEGNTDILASSSTLSCCGNGAVEAGEQCDDANLVDADGCSADCRAESSWQFMGTAEGGVVSLQVNGIEVSVPTVAGQSATLVAQNLSNAIQSEPLLFATGVTAFADDGNLILTAVLSEQFIDDAGL